MTYYPMGKEKEIAMSFCINISDANVQKVNLKLNRLIFMFGRIEPHKKINIYQSRYPHGYWE